MAVLSSPLFGDSAHDVLYHECDSSSGSSSSSGGGGGGGGTTRTVPRDDCGWRHSSVSSGSSKGRAGAASTSVSGLDLSGRRLARVTGVVTRCFPHLQWLSVANNALTSLPFDLFSRAQHLTHLDVSSNLLSSFPRDLVRATQLTTFIAHSNSLSSIPYELGRLTRLSTLDLSGNPCLSLLPPSLSTDGGSLSSLWRYLRDSAPRPPTPLPREWHLRESDTSRERSSDGPSFGIVTYNILCEAYATPQYHPYVPESALAWTYRRALILRELFDDASTQAVDVFCLQEVMGSEFTEVFEIEFRRLGFEGVFVPKSRAKTYRRESAETVDGCATFWRTSRLELAFSRTVEYSLLATGTQSSAAPGDHSGAFSSSFPSGDRAEAVLRLGSKDNVGLVVGLRWRGEETSPSPGGMTGSSSGSVSISSSSNGSSRRDGSVGGVTIGGGGVIQTAGLGATGGGSVGHRVLSSEGTSSGPLRKDGGQPPLLESSRGYSSVAGRARTDGGSSSRTSPAPLVVVNTHLHWDPEFSDVKVVQTHILLDEVRKVLVTEGLSIEGSAVVVAGDLNSLPGSAPYTYLSSGQVSVTHPELLGHSYASWRIGSNFCHPFSLASAYVQALGREPEFTNFTPTFKATIDYVWFTTNTLSVEGVLDVVSKRDTDLVAGFPSHHFPSDHVRLVARLRYR